MRELDHIPPHLRRSPAAASSRLRPSRCPPTRPTAPQVPLEASHARPSPHPPPPAALPSSRVQPTPPVSLPPHWTHLAFEQRRRLSQIVARGIRAHSLR